MRLAEPRRQGLTLTASGERIRSSLWRCSQTTCEAPLRRAPSAAARTSYPTRTQRARMSSKEKRYVGVRSGYMPR